MKNDKIIIGITGTFAAGKDTIADYLEKKGFEQYGLSDQIREFARQKGLEPTRDVLRNLGNEIRDKYGPEYLVKTVIEQKATGNRILISGIRQPAEVEYLKQFDNFILLAVDAPIEMRFERMKKRNRSGDPKTLEELREKEEREMESKGKNCQKIHQCIQMADFILINDGDYQKLYKEVEDAIKGRRVGN